MSTKIHQLVDGQGRPLVVALTPGQAGDSPMLKPLLSHLAVKRLGPGRPRTRPDAVIGDKAYSSRAIRPTYGPDESRRSSRSPRTRSPTANDADRPAVAPRASTR